MSTLVRVASVLDLTYQGRDVVEFSLFDEEKGGTQRFLRFQRDDWLDLGRPNEITITVEPGNQLDS